MLYYALMFLTVGLMARVLNFVEMSAGMVQISWVLFSIGMVLVVVYFARGRTSRTT